MDSHLGFDRPRVILTDYKVIFERGLETVLCFDRLLSFRRD